MAVHAERLGTVARAAVDECGLGAVKPTLYSIRHGGASEDLLRGRRDIGVFPRGRWRAWSSLRRYGEEATLQAELKNVPADILEHVRARATDIEGTLQDLQLAPPLPRRRGANLSRTVYREGGHQCSLGA